MKDRLTTPLDAEEQALAERLRALPAGEPSPQLDARIRAAAHAAVRKRRPAVPLRRWGGALAAVLALGIGIRVTMQPESLTAPAPSAGARQEAAEKLSVDVPAMPVEAQATTRDHADSAGRSESSEIDKGAPPAESIQIERLREVSSRSVDTTDLPAQPSPPPAPAAAVPAARPATPADSRQAAPSAFPQPAAKASRSNSERGERAPAAAAAAASATDARTSGVAAHPPNLARPMPAPVAEQDSDRTARQPVRRAPADGAAKARQSIGEKEQDERKADRASAFDDATRNAAGVESRQQGDAASASVDQVATPTAEPQRQSKRQEEAPASLDALIAQARREHAAGDVGSLEQSLSQLRIHYPNADLPDDIRKWIRDVDRTR